MTVNLGLWVAVFPLLSYDQCFFYYLFHSLQLDSNQQHFSPLLVRSVSRDIVSEELQRINSWMLPLQPSIRKHKQSSDCIVNMYVAERKSIKKNNVPHLKRDFLVCFDAASEMRSFLLLFFL